MRQKFLALKVVFSLVSLCAITQCTRVSRQDVVKQPEKRESIVLKSVPEFLDNSESNQKQPAQVTTTQKTKAVHKKAELRQSTAQNTSAAASISTLRPSEQALHASGYAETYGMPGPPRESDELNTENYAPITENGFHLVSHEPLSTFSADVDNASYANIRRFLSQGQLPPSDAVRIEECINYFRYTYPEPKGEHPFSMALDMGNAPWNDQHKLVLIGLQAKHLEVKNLPPSNLVFLLDVSGSMEAANKLPLLKKSFRLLVEQLRSSDNVSIVVYAGSAGLVLPSTSGANKQTIYDALERLQAGGSTSGGEGLRLAYKVAKQHFLRNGNNRLIIATDGDFNVGESSDGAMMRLVEKERQGGVYLSVLGFGMGNIKDSKMEILADKGNGNYAYIDNLLEARKVLVEQMGGTLHTVAKDVKLQVEFNPAKVSAYRLVGYENRLLNNEDFNDDTKDAGEMGAGHSVSALYEIIPTNMDSHHISVDPLKYSAPSTKNITEELFTVKFRYKYPNESHSRLLSRVMKDSPRNFDETTETFRFVAAVAGFGMMLRNSEHKGNLTFERIASIAENARGNDPEGYRAEFIRLANLAGSLSKGTAQVLRDEE